MFLTRLSNTRIGLRPWHLITSPKFRPSISIIPKYNTIQNGNFFSTRTPLQLHHFKPLQLNNNRNPFGRSFNRNQFGPIFNRYGARFGSSRFAPEFQFLRVIIGVILFTAIFVFVAAPLLFIGIPLVVLLAVAYIRFKASANKLRLAKLISKLSGTSLIYKPRVNLIEDVEFQKFVNNRIRIFIEDGEQGNTLLDRITNINNVSIAAQYSRLLQDWVIEQGEEKLIVIINTEMYDLDSKLLKITITASELPSGEYELVIELDSGRYKYLINDDSQWNSYSDNDRIINIKDYDVRDL